MATRFLQDEDTIRKKLEEEEGLDPALMPPPPEPPTIPEPAPQKAPLDMALEKLLASRGKEDKWDKVSQALYHAGTRTPIPDTFFQKERDPLRDSLAKLMIAQKMKGPKAGIESPSSEASKAEQDLFMSAYPDAPLEAVRKLPGTRLEKYKELGIKTRGVEEKEKSNRSREEFRERALEEKVREHGVNSSLRERGMTETQARTESKRLYDYGNKIDDLKSAHAVMEQIEEIAPGLPRGLVDKDDPSIDVIDRALQRAPLGIGTWFADDKDGSKKLKVQQAFGLLREKIQRPMSGANLTELEVKRFQTIFNDRLMDKPEAQAAAIDLFRKYVGKKLKMAESGVLPGLRQTDTWDYYKRLGGLTSDNSLYNDLKAPESQAPEFTDEAVMSGPEVIEPPASPAPIPSPPSMPKASPAKKSVAKPLTKEEEDMFKPHIEERITPQGWLIRKYADGTIKVFK